MIRIQQGDIVLYLNVNHIVSVEIHETSACIRMNGVTEEYIISSSDGGYDDFMKIIEGLTIHIVSALNPLAQTRSPFQ